jgi:hypothetical protein
MAAARTSAAADELPSCSDARVTTEGALPREWASELTRVCREMSSWRNVDPGVRLRIRALPAGLEVEADLGDGRSTRRRVQTPGELQLTIEALVALPPGLATQTSTAPDTPKSAPPVPPSPAAERPGARVGVDFFGAGTGRISGGPTYVSAGLEGGAGLNVGHWVLALLARWDAWQVPTSQSPPGFEMDTLGAGFSVARRIRAAEALRVDAGVTTMLVTESESFQGLTGERAGSTTETRLGVVGRAAFGASALRGMLVIEGEISPARLRRTLRLDDQLPALPAWSVGLGAGVSWGEP